MKKILLSVVLSAVIIFGASGGVAFASDSAPQNLIAQAFQQAGSQVASFGSSVSGFLQNVFIKPFTNTTKKASDTKVTKPTVTNTNPSTTTKPATPNKTGLQPAKGCHPSCPIISGADKGKIINCITEGAKADAAKSAAAKKFAVAKTSALSAYKSDLKKHETEYKEGTDKCRTDAAKDGSSPDKCISDVTKVFSASGNSDWKNYSDNLQSADKKYAADLKVVEGMPVYRATCGAL